MAALGDSVVLGLLENRLDPVPLGTVRRQLAQLDALPRQLLALEFSAAGSVEVDTDHVL
jgi:hypothetical protein